MVAWRKEISPRRVKKISSSLNERFRISARPSNGLLPLYNMDTLQTKKILNYPSYMKCSQ